MAEGDIYRLLSRTLEYLSQVHQLRATHPDLGSIAAEALSRIRRGGNDPIEAAKDSADANSRFTVTRLQ